MKRIYLAGPDVFKPDALALGRQKKALCAEFGFEGVFPLDNEIEDFRHDSETAFRIARANEKLMDSCHLGLANMEPWHGPSMDVGTAYEMGYLRAQGKPTFAYSTTLEKFAPRVASHFMSPLTPDHSGGLRDPHGHIVETFGDLQDNLMMMHALHLSGSGLHPTFNAALQAARDILQEPPSSAP